MNQAIADPLSRPSDLPLYGIGNISMEPVLVVAPHPDDETLGCGGAIALLRSLKYTVQILVISDGTKSHPNSRKYPKTILKQLRESETRSAMAVLGVETDRIAFLQLCDGAIPKFGTINFQAAVNRCHAYLESVNPKIILAPWRLDPHPDHRATSQILRAALTQIKIPPRVIEYPIWDWDLQQRQLRNHDSIYSWRLDISEVLSLKREAIASYRSQITDLIDDDPTGFRLTPEMLKNFTQPWEIYLEVN
jgi:LmbE family N-acetylglucosaminyl deacetylase